MPTVDQNKWEDWEDISEEPEDVEDIVEPEVEDTHGNDRPSVDQFTEWYAGAAMTYGTVPNYYEYISQNHKDAKARKENPFFPFESFTEWELADWLSRLKCPMTVLDKFFQLKFVKDRPLTFGNAKKFRAVLETLPAGGPQWMSRKVAIPGRETTKPLIFYYRDGLQSFRYLFGNPLFKGHMDHCPRQVWTSPAKEVRIYDEMMTGELTWDIQDKVSPGETLGLVILGSDKTHLTNHQGDKEAHCVYMSCGNIKKDVRNKATARAWLLVGQIPVAK
ncbi:hypothetical protein BD410DRAFT_734142, partial [Rickenella mellea]